MNVPEPCLTLPEEIKCSIENSGTRNFPAWKFGSIPKSGGFQRQYAEMVTAWCLGQRLFNRPVNERESLTACGCSASVSMQRTNEWVFIIMHVRLVVEFPVWLLISSVCRKNNNFVNMLLLLMLVMLYQFIIIVWT